MKREEGWWETKVNREGGSDSGEEEENAETL